jgi:hypothetical protein
VVSSCLLLATLPLTDTSWLPSQYLASQRQGFYQRLRRTGLHGQKQSCGELGAHPTNGSRAKVPADLLKVNVQDCQVGASGVCRAQGKLLIDGNVSKSKRLHA